MQIDHENNKPYVISSAQSSALFVTIGYLEGEVESIYATPETKSLAERVLKLIEKELSPVLKS